MQILNIMKFCFLLMTTTTSLRLSDNRTLLDEGFIGVGEAYDTLKDFVGSFKGGLLVTIDLNVKVEGQPDASLKIKHSKFFVMSGTEGDSFQTLNEYTSAKKTFSYCLGHKGSYLGEWQGIYGAGGFSVAHGGHEYWFFIMISLPSVIGGSVSQHPMVAIGGCKANTKVNMIKMIQRNMFGKTIELGEVECENVLRDGKTHTQIENGEVLYQKGNPLKGREETSYLFQTMEDKSFKKSRGGGLLIQTDRMKDGDLGSSPWFHRYTMGSTQWYQTTYASKGVQGGSVLGSEYASFDFGEKASIRLSSLPVNLKNPIYKIDVTLKN